MTQGSSSLLLEAWRPVLGFEGHYEVSNFGNVRSLSRSITRRDGRKRTYFAQSMLAKVRDGYYLLFLRKQAVSYSRLVHRLVLEAFVGPCPPGMECRHLNGNRLDNRLENLRWGTPEENRADQLLHGTRRRGESNAQAKLSDAEVDKIRAARAKFSTRVLGAMYGVSSSTISRIQTGKRRGWRQP